jgi:hypothetical protein
MGYKRRFVEFSADRRRWTVNIIVRDRSGRPSALAAPQKIALARAEGKANSVAAALANWQLRGMNTRSTRKETAYREQQHSQS